MIGCPLSCAGAPIPWTRTAVPHDTCTYHADSLRLSRVTRASVLRDARTCPREQPGRLA
jgi:hypothetical protein